MIAMWNGGTLAELLVRMAPNNPKASEEKIMSTAFRVVLEGAQENPPTASTATGLGTVIFDSTEVAADYSFRIQGLDFGLATGGGRRRPTPHDDATRSHFHNAARGANGPIVFGQIDPEHDPDDLDCCAQCGWFLDDKRPVGNNGRVGPSINR